MPQQPPTTACTTDQAEQRYTILLPGIPVSADRGALGWCTVALVESAGKRILFDTGSCGDRGLLLQRLGELALAPGALDAVFVSHLHFDHCLNMELFQEVPILVTERELRYVLDGEYAQCRDPYVPAAAIHHLRGRLQPVGDGHEIFPGVKVVALPGHTPGLAGLFLARDNILLAADGIKNAWEFVNHQAPPTFGSPQGALKSYDWAKAHAAEIVPGHDRPFRLNADGRIAYLAEAAPVRLTLFPDPAKGPRTQFLV